MQQLIPFEVKVIPKGWIFVGQEQDGVDFYYFPHRETVHQFRVISPDGSSRWVPEVIFRKEETLSKGTWTVVGVSDGESYLLARPGELTQWCEKSRCEVVSIPDPKTDTLNQVIGRGIRSEVGDDKLNNLILACENYLGREHGIASEFCMCEGSNETYPDGHTCSYCKLINAIKEAVSEAKK